MGIKEQFNKLKENWLLALLLLVIVMVPFFSNQGLFPLYTKSYGAGGESFAVESAMGIGMARGAPAYYPEPGSGNIAPDVQERKIIKSANLASEVERGEFQAAEQRLKASITAADAILLSENVYRSGKESGEAYTGNFQIKVESRKYDAFVTQVKEIGTIVSFSENLQDVTGQHQDLNIELQAERTRLDRYKQLLEKAETTSERIDLSDRIFEQERRIKYLEDALRNMNQEVEYSTITVQLQEKPSGYATIALVKVSELLRSLVNSLNSLLQLLFWVLPYAIAGFIIWKVVKMSRKRR